uniref:Uncharacterized protein n=1 Tax=viral metagenome TaxID=1070528 RepID=A0A6C0H763_9ZZZZ
MQFVMNFRDLAILAGLLFVLYYLFLDKREKLENTSESKACGQNAINEAYLDYVFGGVPSNR